MAGWMDKQQILDEIRRTTKANGGVPLGSKRFAQETGIRTADWYGKHFGRWSDALREAGFAPNTLQDSFSDDLLLEKLVLLVREAGRFPGTGDMRLKKRNDPTFPNEKVFDTHFGSRARQKRSALEYCQKHPGFDDIPALLGELPPESSGQINKRESEPEVILGFVYLMKHGRHYKIGKTNATGRREYELAIQLPERLTTVHVIKTDDPDGIEAYWHKRFGQKRANGEWFALDNGDIAAFKRRRFM
jgi:hypothetical protein